ncbi:MAG: hypothetical protein NWF05_05700 [Candidatus Bathyarchaeota archaeon]|nr:hypothetical protein [Candidatus Bathyarchaeota archaeon]
MNKNQPQTATILSVLFITFIVTAMPVNAETENTWTLSTLDLDSSITRVIAVNDKLYIFTQGDTNQTFLYDPLTNALLSKTSMPNPRSSFGIAYFQGKIYTFGGVNWWTYMGITETYDPASDLWQLETSMPTPRGQITANVVGEKIYIIGGHTGGPSSNVGTNEVYDPSTQTWVTKASMPIPVSGYASTVIDNKIYIMGGSTNLPVNGSSYTNAVQVYDPELDSWTLGTPMPVAVTHTTASHTTGLFAPKKIYVFGGTSPKGMDPIDVVQVFDPSGGGYWSTTTMPSPRFGACSENIEDVLYVVGGASMWALGLNPKDLTVQKFIPIGYKNNLTSPKPTPTISPTPTPGATEISTPSPSLTPAVSPTSNTSTASPSPQESALPSSSPSPAQSFLNDAAIAVLVLVVVLVTAIILILVYSKKSVYSVSLHFILA